MIALTFRFTWMMKLCGFLSVSLYSDLPTMWNVAVNVTFSRLLLDLIAMDIFEPLCCKKGSISCERSANDKQLKRKKTIEVLIFDVDYFL